MINNTTVCQDRVAAVMATSEGQEKFILWFKDEMTQMLLAAAREKASPKAAMGNPSAEAALYQLGVTVGSNDTIDYMSFPKQPAASVGASEATQKLEATYGAQEILDKEK